MYAFVLTVSDGTATATDTVTVQVQVVPVLSVAPDTLDFGMVLVGDSRSLEMQVNNVGSGWLQVSEVEVEEPFGVESVTWPMVVEDQESIRVSFEPEKGGTFEGMLIVHSNGGEGKVWVRGQGNTVPVAEARGNQAVVVEATVQLDGSGSSDADGGVVGYGWAQVVGLVLGMVSNVFAGPPRIMPSQGRV